MTGQKLAAVRGLRVKELLALPVCMHGIRLGWPVDALLDADGYIVGLELVCGDGAHRFLPFSVAQIRPEEIAVESALMLLDERALDYYRTRTRRLAAAGYVEPWIDADGLVRGARTAA